MSIYNPAPASVYGRTENRLKVNTVLHVPQKGSNSVDTVDLSAQIFIVGTKLRYYVGGNYYEVSATSTSAEVGRFGIEDILGVQDRSMDMEQHMLGINNSALTSIQTSLPGATPDLDHYFGFYSDQNYANMYATTGAVPDDTRMGLRCYLDKITINVKGATNPYPIGEHYMPVSVNGVFAGADGNITIPTGSSTPSLQAVTTIGNSTTANIIASGYIESNDSLASPQARAILTTGFSGYLMLKTQTGQFVTVSANNIGSTARTLQLPNADATLVASVNGTLADANGNVTVSAGASGWGLTGNAGTTAGTNFIGTTDSQNLYFKVTNQLSGVLDRFGGMTSFGYQALAGVIGYNNTAFGSGALGAYSSSSGYNVAVGAGAGGSLTSGQTNVAIGDAAMQVATTAAANVVIGRIAGQAITSALNGVVIGQNAAPGLTSGGFNTIIGNNAGPSISTGQLNVVIGHFSGQGGTGSNNVWVGSNNSTSGNSGSNNVALGFNANFSGAVSSSIALGAGATPSTSNQFFLATTITSFKFPETTTAAGTTGAQTISKPFGSVNFAAGASTLVVTNTSATTTSKIFVQVYGTDATASYARVTRASGSFTITLNAAATAETAVGFFIVN
jgi:hypothetical protein